MQYFDYPMFSEVGVTELDGRPMFVAEDAVKALGYKNVNSAIALHCRYAVQYLPDDGREYLIIPEGDFNRLVAGSTVDPSLVNGYFRVIRAWLKFVSMDNTPVDIAMNSDVKLSIERVLPYYSEEGVTRSYSPHVCVSMTRGKNELEALLDRDEAERLIDELERFLTLFSRF
jgi:hypothetical protein